MGTLGLSKGSWELHTTIQGERHYVESGKYSKRWKTIRRQWHTFDRAVVADLYYLMGDNGALVTNRCDVQKMVLRPRRRKVRQNALEQLMENGIPIDGTMYANEFNWTTITKASGEMADDECIDNPLQ